jgi:hypothetical protein
MTRPQACPDRRFSGRTGPAIPYPPDDPAHASWRAALDDEYTELWDARHRMIDARLSRTGTSDPEDLAGEVYWWAWTMMHALTGCTEDEFANKLTRAGKRMARTRWRDRREYSAAEMQIDDMAERAERAMGPQYTPPSRDRDAYDILEERYLAMRRRLCCGQESVPGEVLEHAVGHYEELCAHGHLSLDAATRLIALALLAERSWPGIAARPDVADHLRRAARFLVPGAVITRYGLTPTVAQALDISCTQADRLITRLRTLVDQLCLPFSSRAVDRDTLAKGA